MPSPWAACRCASCVPASPRSCSRRRGRARRRALLGQLWPCARSLAAHLASLELAGDARARTGAAGWPCRPSWPHCAGPTCSPATSPATPSSSWRLGAAGARSGGRSRRWPTCTSPPALTRERAFRPRDRRRSALRPHARPMPWETRKVSRIGPAALLRLRAARLGDPLAIPLAGQCYRIAQCAPRSCRPAAARGPCAVVPELATSRSWSPRGGGPKIRLEPFQEPGSTPRSPSRAARAGQGGPAVARSPSAPRQRQ